MKRILAFILIAIASYASMVVGKLQEHPFWLYLGMVVAGMLALGLVVWLVKLTAKFIGWALTSVLYLVGAMAVIGLLSWYGKIPTIAGFGAGVLLSGCLLLTFMRRLAKWAQTSMFFGEVFQFLSAYQIRSYIHNDTLVPKEQQINLTLDFKNIVVVLKQLGFPTSEAKEAATYVFSELPSDTSQNDRIREAIKFLGSKDTVEVYRASQN